MTNLVSRDWIEAKIKMLEDQLKSTTDPGKRRDQIELKEAWQKLLENLPQS